MRRLMLLTGLLAANVGANAADNGVYVGVSIGQASVEVDDFNASADFEGDDLGFKIIAGVRPLDWLGFEANYVNFWIFVPPTESSGSPTEGYGIAGYAVGLLGLGPVDVFAKGGVVSWDTKIDGSHFDGTDLAYGVGVQFRLLSLGVRAEYEIFDIDDLDSSTMLSVGVTYTFP